MFKNGLDVSTPALFLNFTKKETDALIFYNTTIFFDPILTRAVHRIFSNQLLRNENNLYPLDHNDLLHAGSGPGRAQ